jgi:hypothetical protein
MLLKKKYNERSMAQCRGLQSSKILEHRGVDKYNRSSGTNKTKLFEHPPLTPPLKGGELKIFTLFSLFSLIFFCLLSVFFLCKLPFPPPRFIAQGGFQQLQKFRSRHFPGAEAFQVAGSDLTVYQGKFS